MLFRSGRLPKIMTLEECVQLVKNRFDIETVKVFGDLHAELETCAISPGSGKSMITNA